MSYGEKRVIFQDILKKAMQAYLQYKAYYDKKANDANFKETNYMDDLQAKVDHQGSNVFFTEIR